MTLGHWCVLVAALLPVACAWIAKAGRFGFRENRDPRAWLAQQSGWRACERGAGQQLRGAAVFHRRGADRAPGAGAATLATLRSLAWTGGVACCVALVLIGA